MQARINQSVDHHEPQLSQVTPSAAPDLRTARLQALQQDANELSSLSASVQSDLQKLQKELVKDVNENLKKMRNFPRKCGGKSNRWPRRVMASIPDAEELPAAANVAALTSDTAFRCDPLERE
jgi:hypothetical protein